jgi:hypothetical protein
MCGLSPPGSMWIMFLIRANPQKLLLLLGFLRKPTRDSVKTIIGAGRRQLVGRVKSTRP